MTTQAQTFCARSWLFAPGDSERKMEKAMGGTADVVILDLEDSVTETEKPNARAICGTLLLKATAEQRERLWVRINPVQGPHALADLAAVIPGAPAGIVLPKPRGRADAELLDRHLTDFEAVAGIAPGITKVMVLATETPESMLAIGSYAGVPRMTAMSWGAEDLATALGASDNRGDYGGYDFTYELARSLCLVGAAAAGVAAIETIHADFRDEAGLRKRAAAVRRAGYRGMLAIHPAQVDIINETFSPTAAEIASAQEIVDLFAANPGAGTIGHKGAMLDRPHLARAQAVLAMAGRK
jgi:citrate lyase subunit beta / citryl-CoA lyase